MKSNWFQREPRVTQKRDFHDQVHRCELSKSARQIHRTMFGHACVVVVFQLLRFTRTSLVDRLITKYGKGGGVSFISGNRLYALHRHCSDKPLIPNSDIREFTEAHLPYCERACKAQSSSRLACCKASCIKSDVISQINWMIKERQDKHFGLFAFQNIV